jgi:hypothetical protein
MAPKEDSAAGGVIREVEERLQKEVGSCMGKLTFRKLCLPTVQLEHAARVVWGPDSCSCMPRVLAACAKAQKQVAVDPAYVAAAQLEQARRWAARTHFASRS